MPTRNVVLTAHQSDLVEELVRTGRYQNASEVLREGLRLVEQREQRDAVKLAALRAVVSEGQADLAAGRYVEIDDDGLDAYLAELGERAASRRRMSTQIAVRLPDDMVAFLDQAVAQGKAPSRAALVTSALEREMRRQVAEQDAAILREHGAADDLDALVDWTMHHIDIADERA